MALAAWWYEDGLSAMPLAAGVTVESDPADMNIAWIARLPLSEVTRRRAEGHRAYLVRVDGQPAGYGWVATREASIGELDLSFTLPAGHRYLWDFATLPHFRGRGVYPQLLAEIVRRECPPATRLWIIHAPENLPSGVGIARAGFAAVAELSFDEDVRPALAIVGDRERGRTAGWLFGLPIATRALDPCWGCGGCSCDHEAGGGCGCAVIPGR